VLEQLKNIKVKDIILVHEFDKLMDVNDKNVKEFKKFMKGKNESQAK